MYIIMTDTSANLEPADLKKWEIEDLPLTYMVDGKSPLDSGDAAFDARRREGSHLAGHAADIY